MGTTQLTYLHVWSLNRPNVTLCYINLEDYSTAVLRFSDNYIGCIASRINPNKFIISKSCHLDYMYVLSSGKSSLLSDSLSKTTVTASRTTVVPAQLGAVSSFGHFMMIS